MVKVLKDGTVTEHPFEDTDLLTKPAATAYRGAVSPGTITVDAAYWNRLMALRDWARNVLDLRLETDHGA